MLCRGSIQACAMNALSAYRVNGFPMLSILYNPKGRYYSVATEDDLKKSQDDQIHGHIRLVFRGTEKELLKLMTSPQRTLFTGGDDAAT